MNELYQGREPVRATQQKDWFYRFALAAAIVFLYFGLVAECFSQPLCLSAPCKEPYRLTTEPQWATPPIGFNPNMRCWLVQDAQMHCESTTAPYDAKIKALEQRVRALEKANQKPQPKCWPTNDKEIFKCENEVMQTVPAGDGCNTCTRLGGNIISCTALACLVTEPPCVPGNGVICARRK